MSIRTKIVAAAGILLLSAGAAYAQSTMSCCEDCACCAEMQQATEQPAPTPAPGDAPAADR